jgi:general secretion pathway protein G
VTGENSRRSYNNARALRQGGFTLIELVTVMMIMSILAAIAIPSYKRSQIKAKETVLLEDLYQMRKAIDAYYADKGSYPEDFEELVAAKYLRAMPEDPFTRSPDTWVCEPPEVDMEGQLAEGGCFDIRSGSDLVGLNSTAYQEW